MSRLIGVGPPKVRRKGPGMQIHEGLLRTIGFTVPEGQSTPNGTCFLATIGCDLPGHRHGYVITAEHCVIASSTTAIWMLDATGQRHLDGEVSAWVTDHDNDIAVAEWHDQADKRLWAGSNLNEVEDRPITVRYGDSVIYAGLLIPVLGLAEQGAPAVREGTVSAFNAPNIEYGERRIASAHLMDVRSRRGFSGSPCWVGRLFIPVDQLRESADPFVGPWSFTFLWGMLLGWGDKDGLGVVVPIERTIEVIRKNPDLASARDKADKAERKRRRDDGGLEEASEPSQRFTEGDFLSDLSKATRPYPPPKKKRPSQGG